ncbi:hypothetical protein [Methanosarcina sp.]|uniref:hypothetical protein n=1 Tax=Methanosarcina sp. TaxID=2213 RepID=UPI0029883958|nr:hypothetical protein [Methanosarcina sp.]MDW5548649.1 hypothetical protein [Methanosarcina sp.]MDW5553886.1 hypothetical protein [Methanosarcina sp.]MDW5558789.1 hypothetical protein [Methanosarcina sp.]
MEQPSKRARIFSNLRKDLTFLSVREVSKKIAGSNIHDVTILHNIKLMRELVKEKCRECRKRLANLYKRSVKLSNGKAKKFNSRKA